jgi:hypothetical protein
MSIKFSQLALFAVDQSVFGQPLDHKCVVISAVSAAPLLVSAQGAQ